LSTLSRGSLDEKLKWTFQLYDVNGDGFISREEMTEVMTSVYELMGKVPEGCKAENQIKEKVENTFKVRFVKINGQF
jgi:Ca2+-binding EF-hand superfamily protein